MSINNTDNLINELFIDTYKKLINNLLNRSYKSIIDKNLVLYLEKNIIINDHKNNILSLYDNLKNNIINICDYKPNLKAELTKILGLYSTKKSHEGYIIFSIIKNMTINDFNLNNEINNDNIKKKYVICKNIIDNIKQKLLSIIKHVNIIQQCYLDKLSGLSKSNDKAKTLYNFLNLMHDSKLIKFEYFNGKKFIRLFN